MIESPSQDTPTANARRPLLRKVRHGLVFVAMLAGIAAFAQVLSPLENGLFSDPDPEDPGSYDPSKYCYLAGGIGTEYVCRDTRADAEAAMRADPQFGGIGQYLERLGGGFPSYATEDTQAIAQDFYKIQNRLPVSDGLMYRVKFGSGESAVVGSFGCQSFPGDTYPGYESWCSSEDELVTGAAQHLASSQPTCTLGQTRILIDHSNDPLHETVKQHPSNPRHGIIDLGTPYDDQYRNYETDITCPGENGGAPVTTGTIWTMQRHKNFMCQTGFVAQPAAPAVDGNYCGPGENHSAVLLSPITQTCSGVPGAGTGPGPGNCNPATGDKMETESDLEFAGRPFTRYYHSTGQFRNNPRFAESWTHSYTDRLSGFPGSTFVSVIGEEGYYELFKAVGTNRFKAGMSGERQLDYLTQPVGTVRWRLRESSGEIREFDGTGKLVAVRDPAAPLKDVTVAYGGDNAVVSLTDRQGRVLRFEYTNRLLSRVVKPDGTSVAYGYDTYDNLVSVDYGNSQIRQYHYAEFGEALNKFVHHLTGITSETGQRLATFSYNDQGKLIRSRMLGSPNEVTQIAYDSDEQSTVITPEGAVQTYTISGGLYRRITDVQTAGMGTSNHDYDTSGFLSSVTDREGVVTRYEYDTTHRDVIAIIEADTTQQQRRTEFTRDPQTRRVTEQRVLDNASALVAKAGMVYNDRQQVDPAPASRTPG